MAVLGAAGVAKQFWRSVMPNYRQSKWQVRKRDRQRMAGPIPRMAVEAIKGFLTIPG
jgi:hypothetical protein